MRLQLNPGALSLSVLSASFVVAAGASAQSHPWTLASDGLLYTDTDNVLVVTSQLSVARALDEDGGQASANVIVDVVSAASVDVVAQASSRFDEVRGETNLGLAYAVDGTLPSINYRGSIEPDYVSHGVGAGCQLRLGGADSVARAHYQVTLDTIGRSGTPFSTFSRSLTSHAAELSLTQNLGPEALLRGVYTLTVQDGYMEKPYRYVPLFDAAGLALARRDGVTLGLDTFDRYRLAPRPAESVPDLRLRHALALRLLQYIAPLAGAVRVDYRFYIDDWGIVAHTAELGYEQPLGERWTLGFYARGYTQGAASFYRATYQVESPRELPGLRTVDRKLAGYEMGTFGTRLELQLDAITAYLDSSVEYTRFRDFIYLDHVFAAIAQAGLAWTF